MASSVRAVSCTAGVATSRGAFTAAGPGRALHQPPAPMARTSAAGTRRVDRRRDRIMQRRSGLGVDEEQGLAVLHRLSALDQDSGDAPGHLGLDLVHELHRLDDAEDLALLDHVALL